MLHYKTKDLQLKCQQINFMGVLGSFDNFIHIIFALLWLYRYQQL